jgi:hypothetical protein
MNSNQPRSYQALIYLLIVATIVSGLLAGGTIDRFIVQFPAFRQIDISYWAVYSRHADLGNGFYLYPPEAIIPLICLVIAAYLVSGKNEAIKPLRLPVYISLFLSLSGLFFTIFAAPVMLSVKNMPDNPVMLKQAFEDFYFWSGFRGIAQILLFFSCLWGFGRIMKTNLPV